MISYIDIDSIGLGAESIVGIAKQAELWRVKFGEQIACLKLGESGVVYKDSQPLPVWIPLFTLLRNATEPQEDNSASENLDSYSQFVSLIRNPQDNFACAGSADIGCENIQDINTSLPTITPSDSTIILPGCFDRLHQGHLNLIKASRYLGARVIVIIDSDERLISRKGRSRPFRLLCDRIKDIQNTGLVNDIRILSHQSQFEPLLRNYHDPVVVKGAEYRCGFVEYTYRTGDWWGAICVESHSDDRSSNNSRNVTCNR